MIRLRGKKSNNPTLPAGNQELVSGQVTRARNLYAGQVMLLSVLLIGSSILVFSTIAGYLMTQRIKLASSSVDSAKAFFAAESGLECELYRFNFQDPNNIRNVNCGGLVFSDSKTSVTTTINIGANAYFKSVGTSNNANRALLFVPSP